MAQTTNIAEEIQYGCCHCYNIVEIGEFTECEICHRPVCHDCGTEKITPFKHVCHWCNSAVLRVLLSKKEYIASESLALNVKRDMK